MSRIVRCQGAIVQDHQLLLIQHREHASGRGYWVLPGGGQEDGEGEEDCVAREMREETGLEVQVKRLLLDEPAIPVIVYQRRKTYLCRVLGGKAAPGFEPEVEVAELYGIVAVQWFDLRDPTTWEPQVLEDAITLRQFSGNEASSATQALIAPLEIPRTKVFIVARNKINIGMDAIT
jgi:8-oxo-dGTP pyrophosphatase MutT (NUDIX family)